ncbi:hypothetical protein ACH0B5_09960 [Ureibacillus sp. 179-F W5.1 NHS]|uniref:Uncharacterized protein n=1 Tax=Lysinibacillus halotolerans TaxID=1368476 RepID=A0A3M8H5D1_9BACI|nr:hypothetical protein [Lysinibacillus halotolerans]RNC97635.1 hypothetical protein EC501_14545 [Lysinibacillus halotolerans]
MKKTWIKRTVLVTILVIILVFYWNEYRTKKLVEAFFDTYQLSEEIHDITIINLSEEDILKAFTIIDEEHPLHPTVINSIEKLTVKRIPDYKETFSFSEGYSVFFIYNNTSNHIYINKNGIVYFNGKEYEIQGKEIVKDLFEILERAEKNKPDVK